MTIPDHAAPTLVARGTDIATHEYLMREGWTYSTYSQLDGSRAHGETTVRTGLSRYHLAAFVTLWKPSIFPAIPLYRRISKAHREYNPVESNFVRMLPGMEMKSRSDFPIMPATRHCLLIVDDEPDVCDSVHDLLRREFRVLKANSAQEGYRIMLEEEVHIVMSDQRMPQITGVELLTKVKARHPQAIRMLFTGFADLESIIAAINQGHIYQVMKKPWQPEELIVAVRQAAVEFDRLDALAHEREQLAGEVAELKQRVTVLETEVQTLQRVRIGDSPGLGAPPS